MMNLVNNITHLLKKMKMYIIRQEDNTRRHP